MIVPNELVVLSAIPMWSRDLTGGVCGPDCCSTVDIGAFSSCWAVNMNIGAIAILSRGKCGLSKCITRYLVAMASADLSVIVCGVLLHRLVALYWWESFLNYTSVCRFVVFIVSTAVDFSVWFTVAFSFDRFVAISTQNLKTKYCTPRTALVAIVTLSALLCLKNVPWPFALNSYDEIVPKIPSGCVISPLFYYLPTWIAFSWIDQLLKAVLPFCLIFLLNALTIRTIVVSSRVRRSLRAPKSGEKVVDQEIVNRRQPIILLLAISSTFIILWATKVAYFVYYHILQAFRRRTCVRPHFAFENIGEMLQLLSTCRNAFIYTVTQRKFRSEMLQALIHPFVSIRKLMKLT